MGKRDRIVSVTRRKQEVPEKNKCWRTEPEGQNRQNCENYGKKERFRRKHNPGVQSSGKRDRIVRITKRKARGSGENQMLAYEAQWTKETIVRVIGRKQEAPGKTECWRTKAQRAKETEL